MMLKDQEMLSMKMAVKNNYEKNGSASSKLVNNQKSSSNRFVCSACIYNLNEFGPI